MPDNPPPATQPESSSEPAEFNFDKPASQNPRIKRRSLKAKTSGLQPATPAPASARELEREAPPHTTGTAPGPISASKPSVNGHTEPAPRATPVAPPRTKPPTSTASPATSAGLSGTTVQRTGTTSVSSTAPVRSASQSSSAAAPKSVSSPTAPASPHGTRPATLYYSSYPKKEPSSSMKPTPNASPAASSSSSSSAAAAPASSARPASVGSTPATRPSTVNIDYRANVDRQSREQKSVGNLLAYFVYGLIAVFLIGGGLAIYGSVIIFDKLHDQSATLSDLDARYALKVNALNTQIAATQDTLAQAQAQIARQQDLINRQQEDLGRLITAMTDNATAIKAEKQSRAQETASLRARVRDLEYKTTVQKF